MKFGVFSRRLSPAANYGSDWSSFVFRFFKHDGAMIEAFNGSFVYPEVVHSLRMFLASSYLRSTIAGHIGSAVEYASLSFVELRDGYVDSCARFGRSNKSPSDVYHHAAFRRQEPRGFLFGDPTSFLRGRNVIFENAAVPAALLPSGDTAAEISLFAHGATRLSILRQVLDDLRYPWPGRLAAENAPALIKSFWWRPPFGADRITVFVTPDNPALLDSLCAEFPDPFQTEWGQTLCVSFEPFHSRD